jgi:anti-sigma B factor antagonist
MTVRLTHRSEDGIDYLIPVGSLDHAVAKQLQEQFLGIVAEGRTRLVLDLEQVPVVDSSGLGTIVTVFKAARRVGGSLVLMNVHPEIQSIIRITRLDKVLLICADESEARERLRP